MRGGLKVPDHIGFQIGKAANRGNHLFSRGISAGERLGETLRCPLSSFDQWQFISGPWWPREPVRYHPAHYAQLLSRGLPAAPPRAKQNAFGKAALPLILGLGRDIRPPEQQFIHGPFANLGKIRVFHARPPV